MIFLNPAILFGLFAASIPILIHLLNRRKLKKVEFSTLAFLKELQKTKIRKIKLKQWILLVLRVLIIALLVASFARPTIRNATIGGAAPAAKTSAVIIIDNTFSMSAVEEGGSYFNQAKQTAKTILNNLGEGDDVTILPLSYSDNNFIHSTNHKNLIKYLNKLQISDEFATINQALIKAGQILSESKNYNKEIYLLSDFQKSELNISSKKLTAFKNLFSKSERFYYFNYSGKALKNLSLSNFKIKNQIIELNKPVGFSLNVTNRSKFDITNQVVSLFISGKRVARRSINLKPFESKKIIFETTLTKNGYLNIYTKLEDDDILKDNENYLCLFVPRKISVGVFSDNKQDSKFIVLALSGNPSNYVQIIQKSSAQLDATDLNNFNTIIIIGSKGFVNYNRIKTFLNSGGGIFFMPGSKSTLNSFRNFCKKVNIPLSSALFSVKKNSTSFLSFDKIDFNNPLFRGLFQGNKKPNIESPKIYKEFKFSTNGRGIDIISLVDKSAFLSEFKYGKGKILLMNSAPVLTWNNFPLKGLFAPLINKIVFYLSQSVNTGHTYLAGENITVNISKARFSQIKVLRPDKTTEVINLNKDKSKSFIEYKNANILGIYKFYSGGKILDYASVNPDPRESDGQYLAKKKFIGYLKKIDFNGYATALSPKGNFIKKIYQSRFGAELWRYFLIVALLLIILEMFVAKSSKKDLGSGINSQ